MTAHTRRRVLAAAAMLVVIGGVTLFNRYIVRSGPAAAELLVLSAFFALAAVTVTAAEWPRSRVRVVALAVAAGLISLVATSAHVPREAPQDAFWILVEVLALLALLVLVVRFAPRRAAVVAGALVSVAAVSTMWRITVRSPSGEQLPIIGALLNWSFGAIMASGLGLYLRTLDTKRSEMVLQARRSQRLELARDLHDFVAHDVTGMVVQAQAAHLVARRDPHEAIAALERIEEAGLRALGSLDHTVRMLGDIANADGTPTPSANRSDERSEARAFGLEDVLALVGRFAVTDLRPIRLHAETGEARIPPEVASTAYRVILEALTNVRRHAGAAARVEVSIATKHAGSGTTLQVRVTNDLTAPDEPPLVPRRAESSLGGRGLAQLAQCVEEAGGTFEAGALGVAMDAWHVTAVLPLGQGAHS